MDGMESEFIDQGCFFHRSTLTHCRTHHPDPSGGSFLADRWSPALRRRSGVFSPDLQKIDKERMQQRQRRLHRVAAVASNSQYRSTTGQTSSFASLR